MSVVRRFPVVVLGGTFDRLHDGHRDLLERAFRRGRTVGVGLTTDAYLRARPKPLAARIGSYRSRRRHLVDYLRSTYPARRWWISPLSDGWGRAVEPGIQAIVVSPESRKGAEAVNLERRRRGLPRLAWVRVPLRYAEDGLPISSRRIRSGVIDPAGARIRPVVVALTGFPRSEAIQIRTAFQERFPGPGVRMIREGVTGGGSLLPTPDFLVCRAGRVLRPGLSSPSAHGDSRYDEEIRGPPIRLTVVRTSSIGRALRRALRARPPKGGGAAHR